MNYKELLNTLPSSWSHVTLADYIKLSPVISDEEVDELEDPYYFTVKHLSDIDKSIQIISLLTDTPVEIIEQFTMVQLNELINKISFIGTIPQNPITTVRYKKFDKLTYDDFITFEKLSLDFTPDKVLTNAVHNLPLMLSVFSAEKLKEEDFLNLSMPEVIAGFFIVTKNIEKYLRRFRASSYKQLMKIQVQNGKRILMLFWQNRRTSKRSLTRNGTIG